MLTCANDASAVLETICLACDPFPRVPLVGYPLRPGETPKVPPRDRRTSAGTAPSLRRVSRRRVGHLAQNLRLGRPVFNDEHRLGHVAERSALNFRARGPVASSELADASPA